MVNCGHLRVNIVGARQSSKQWVKLVKMSVPFLKVLSFLFADIFPAASDLLTVLHICFRFSRIILKKKKKN